MPIGQKGNRGDIGPSGPEGGPGKNIEFCIWIMINQLIVTGYVFMLF